MISALLYFLTGVVQDVIITWGTQTTVEGKAWPASTLSFLNTLMSGTVYLTLFEHLGDSMPNLIAYALGGSLGVAGTILIRKRRKNGKTKNVASKSIFTDDVRANRKSGSKRGNRSEHTQRGIQ